MEFTVSVISHSQMFDLVSTIFTTRKQSMRGYVFTGVCSQMCGGGVHGGGVCVVGVMHGMHDPPPPADTMRYGQ